MKQASTAMMPGYKVYDYRIVLDPHADLHNRISDVKKEFNKEYGLPAQPGGKPNLCLVRFSQYEMMESRIVGHLNTLAMGYAPFKVELKDFGSFPSHTIFINVTSKVPVQNLVKLIRSDTQRFMKLDDDNKPHFITEPYITVGAKLKPWQYEKGWLEYSNKHFTGRFIADAMLLLKRAQGEWGWQVLKRFQFQNLPVETKQGDLFA